MGGASIDAGSPSTQPLPQKFTALYSTQMDEVIANGLSVVEKVHFVQHSIRQLSKTHILW